MVSDHHHPLRLRNLAGMTPLLVQISDLPLPMFLFAATRSAHQLSPSDYPTIIFSIPPFDWHSVLRGWSCIWWRRQDARGDAGTSDLRYWATGGGGGTWRGRRKLW